MSEVEGGVVYLLLDERERWKYRIANGRNANRDRLHSHPFGREIDVPVRVLRYRVKEAVGRFTPPLLLLLSRFPLILRMPLPENLIALCKLLLL